MEMNWTDINVATPEHKVISQRRVSGAGGEVWWTHYADGRHQVQIYATAFFTDSEHDALVIAAELAEIAAEVRARVEGALARHAHIDTLEANHADTI